MGAEDNSGLSLEGLARRLETLERENAALRRKVATLEGSDTAQPVEPVSETGGQVSRRALLSKAGAAAVAAVAAGTLLGTRPASAHHYDAGIGVNHVLTHYVLVEAQNPGDGALDARNTAGSRAAVFARNSGSGPGIRGINTAGGTGVEGSSLQSDGIGVHGEGVAGGVLGVASKTGHAGVTGTHSGSGFGVVGDGVGFSNAGVLGRNPSGTGVRGEGSNQAEVAGVRGLGKTGVWGSISAGGYSGVYGQHRGSSGFGVVGDGKGVGAGVLGRNPNTGGVGVRGEGHTGVWGTSDVTIGVVGQHTGPDGIGVQGVGRGASAAGVSGVNKAGYGGSFLGGKAQLLLAPGLTAGKPGGAHQQGEIYLDSAGTLFVCTESGDPATWRRIQTVAV